MKTISKKLILCMATISMIFTTLLCNIPITVNAASEKPMFEVNKADEVINEAKTYRETICMGC